VRLRANVRVPAELRERDIIAHPASGTCTHVPATLLREIRETHVASSHRHSFASGVCREELERVFFELEMSFDHYYYFLYIRHVFSHVARMLLE